MARQLTPIEQEAFILALSLDAQASPMPSVHPAGRLQDDWRAIVDTQEWPQFIIPPEVPAEQ